MLENILFFCTCAPEWYSDYQDCMSVSVTTRKKQNKAFSWEGGNEVKGQSSIGCELDRTWNHCGLVGLEVVSQLQHKSQLAPLNVMKSLFL